MRSVPELPLATGTVPLDDGEPLLVDPRSDLLEGAIDTLVDAVPSLAEPDLETLRSAASSETDPLDPPSESVTLSVLARRSELSETVDTFHAASRIAALVEGALLVVRVLEEPQPNTVLAGTETARVLLDTDDGPYPIGSDPSLRTRYADLRDAADSFRLTAPSRHRLYDAFYTRCDEVVADDVIEVLDVDPDPRSDVVGARLRAYLVGARHERLDHTLRRACEDAGLGSPATFTSIKRRLVDAGLVTTERVSQPVGRPRKRLIEADPLADTTLPETVDIARAELRE